MPPFSNLSPPRVSVVIVRGADRKFREIPVVRLRKSRCHGLKQKCSSDPAACDANLPV